MIHKANIPAILSTTARTVEVVFPRRHAHTGNLTPYLFVSAYNVTAGDWVTVPTPNHFLPAGKQAATSLSEQQNIPPITPILPNNKIPTMALVVKVHDCVLIPEDCTYPISWLITGTLDIAPYMAQLVLNNNVVKLADAAEQDKAKEKVKNLVETTRQAVLDSLGAYCQDVLEVIHGKKS